MLPAVGPLTHVKEGSAPFLAPPGERTSVKSLLKEEAIVPKLFIQTRVQ